MYGREKEVWVDNQPEEYTLSMALAAGWLEDIWDMIDAQASEDEMLAKGYDPDMVNEYCCDSIQDRSSVDALYGPQDAALIALKKKRATKILKKEDPGMLTAEEKKIATVIPRPGSTPNAQPAAASQAKQASSKVKAGRAPIPPQKEQPVGNPSEGKKLGIFDYVALYKRKWIRFVPCWKPSAAIPMVRSRPKSCGVMKKSTAENTAMITGIPSFGWKASPQTGKRR